MRPHSQGGKGSVPLHPGRIRPSVLFLVFVLWTLVLTYPLLLHLFTHIPQGDERVGTVPLFNLWTLQWNIDQLVRGYPNYWDAPIFAPAKNSFAFSETQPLSALLAAPLWLGLEAPTVGYNAVVLFFLTLNGWFAFWLLRSWGVSWLPAMLAALLTQSLPFVAQEMGVLQLLALFGLLWSLLFLTRILKSEQRGSSAWRNGFALALGTPATFFTCSYYGLCSIFFLPLAFIFQLRKKHISFNYLGRLSAIALLILMLTGPFLWAQRRSLASYGFSRSAQTVENNSARLQYYLNFLDHNLLYRRILAREPNQGQHLFPGVVLPVLAGLGLFGPTRQRIKRYLLAAVILAFLLSLGLRLEMAGFLPFQWIRDHIPGFAQLRSPFRFAALLQLHLALLAGFGLHNLARWLLSDQKSLLVLISALAIFESLALPLPLQPVTTESTGTPWQSWLNGRNETTSIVILPFAASNRVADFESTTRWMLQTRQFRGDMLNGYSGFFPPDHGQHRAAMLQFPTTEAIALLRDRGIDYVLVFHRLPAAPEPQAIETALPLVFYDQANDVAIYALK